MRYLIFLMFALSISCCSKNSETIDLPVRKIIIKSIDKKSEIWSYSLRETITQRDSLNSISYQISNFKVYQKDNRTKYPPIYFWVVINDCIEYGFLPDKQIFKYMDKHYKLEKPLKILKE